MKIRDDEKTTINKAWQKLVDQNIQIDIDGGQKFLIDDGLWERPSEASAHLYDRADPFWWKRLRALGREVWTFYPDEAKNLVRPIVPPGPSELTGYEWLNRETEGIILTQTRSPNRQGVPIQQTAGKPGTGVSVDLPPAPPPVLVQNTAVVNSYEMVPVS
jgi:hypothetical protein